MDVSTDVKDPDPRAPQFGEGGVLWQVLLSHWRMRSATRAMLDAQPSETRLLVLLILACLIIYAGRSVGLVVEGADNLLARIGTNFIASIMIAIPAFYGLAGLTGLIAHAFTGDASWRETRTAVFWAALATSPVVFAATVASAYLTADPRASMALELLGSAYFGYAFCIAVAMVNKFRTAWGVFGVTAAILIVILGGLWLLTGGMG